MHLRAARPRIVVVAALAVLASALPTVASSPPLAVVRALVDTVALTVGSTVADLSGERLVGVVWDEGTADVQVRWRTAGAWSAWEVPEQSEGDPAAGDAGRPGTEPLWVPTGADQVEVLTGGAPQGLTLARVLDGGPVRGLLDGLGVGSPATAAVGHPQLGTVQTRADWGADESLRRGAPSYADAVKAVAVHHTAGRNDYRPEDVPAIIRADYAYHVGARGWNDLGYNLLVDKFGRIWEGRAGGLGRATIGSHAGGFNTGTLGVSIIGDLTKAAPTEASVDAVARVVAYAAQTWGFDPAGTTTLRSGGSNKHPAGSNVALGRAFGHQQVTATACPGQMMGRLGDVRARAAGVLGGGRVDITAVSVTGSPVAAPTPLVVSATLGSSADWAIEVLDSAGQRLAVAVGTSAAPRLEWNGLTAPLSGLGLDLALVPASPGPITWQVLADDGRGPVLVRGPAEIGRPLLG